MEEISTALVCDSAFKKEHITIQEQFIDKIRTFLERTTVRPKTYGIDECEYSGMIKESLKLTVDDKTEIEIHLRVKT